MKTKNSHLHELDVLRSSTPILQYDKAANISEWKREAREKLTQMLGLPFASGDGTVTIEYCRELDGYAEYRFSVETERDYFVPCHLLIPKSDKAVPLTICLSGHGGGMHVALGNPKTEKDEKALKEWPHRNMAHRSLKEGRAALVIEARNFGESSLEGYGSTCTESAKIALLMGRTVAGERVWDAMRILDAVEKHFTQIDMTNIVCTGNSGGGTVSYYLACLDERITAAAPSCSICEYEYSIAAMPHCICNHIPNIRKYFEMSDLAGLISPRVLVIAAGKEDDIFPIEGTEKTFEHIQKIYEASGAQDKCALVVGDGGHLNYADLIWEKLHQMNL